MMLAAYSSYRQPLMRWLPPVPDHWDEERAKVFFREVDERSRTGDEELLSVSHLTGVTPRSQKNVTMFKAESYVGHKVCRPGDIVVNTLWAWMAALGAARHTGLVSPAYGIYRPHNTNSFNPTYLDYLLRTRAYMAEYIGRSTGIRASRLRLYPNEFLDIPLIQPPRAEQDQIVAYLRAQDAHIARFIKAKRDLIGLLDEQRQSVIRSAVTSGSKGTDGATQIDQNLWFGSVPSHWRIKRLKHLVRFLGGGTPSKAVDSYWSGPIPWVSPKDMRTDSIFDSQDHISESALHESVVQLVPTGAVLIVVRSGILRRRIPVALNLVQVTLNQDMKALVPRGEITGPYLKYLIEGYQQSLLRAWSKVGATVESLEHPYLANSLIPIPPIDEQCAICEQLGHELQGIHEAAEREKQTITLMLEYRDRLIADVVTGQADVRGWVPGPDDVVADEDLVLLSGDEELNTDGEEDDGDD
jgi:type I restriction enzyme S subunit